MMSASDVAAPVRKGRASLHQVLERDLRGIFVVSDSISPTEADEDLMALQSHFGTIGWYDRFAEVLEQVRSSQ